MRKILFTRSKNIIKPIDYEKIFGPQGGEILSISDCDQKMIEYENLYLIYRPDNFCGQKITTHTLPKIYREIVAKINKPQRENLRILQKELDIALEVKTTDSYLLQERNREEIYELNKKLLSEDFYNHGTLDIPSRLEDSEIDSGWFIVSKEPLPQSANKKYFDQTDTIKNKIAELGQKFECLKWVEEGMKAKELVADDFRHGFTELIIDIVVIYASLGIKYIEDVFSWTKTHVPEDRISDFKGFMFVGGGSDYHHSLVCFGDDYSFDQEPDLKATFSIKIK